MIVSTLSPKCSQNPQKITNIIEVQMHTPSWRPHQFGAPNMSIFTSYLKDKEWRWVGIKWSEASLHFVCYFPPWKLTWHWKIHMFNRKYIFIHGGFSIAILYDGVYIISIKYWASLHTSFFSFEEFVKLFILNRIIFTIFNLKNYLKPSPCQVNL